MTVPNDSPSTVIPKVGRNDLCSCGSKIKYKLCHESIRYPYMAMGTSITLRDEGYKSGKIFQVLNIGAY